MSNEESRVRKTLLNVRVNFIFYFLFLALSFFSRKIFLNALSADFLGLTGTLQSLLGYLNLVELGIGSAIGFNLYKPIQQKDKEKINDLISLYGYYYRYVGLLVGVGGFVLSLFLPLIFKGNDFSLGVIYFAYYSFLTSSLITYFINYKATLLYSDQRGYVVSAYFQTGALIKILIQMSIAYIYNSYYAWIGIELFFGLFNATILNWKIRQLYPWLKSSIKRGKSVRNIYPNILTSTKQVFIHKMKDFILGQSSQFFIFMFVSLKMVAYYGNYTLIIQKASALFNMVINSADASIGNLVAEGNKSRMMSIFWELMALRYFVAGFVCFCFFALVNPFIKLWLGSEYILSNSIVVIMLINQFIGISRGAVDEFNHAFGHYADVWSAWFEGVLALSCTLLFGWMWGIAGILLSGTVCAVSIGSIWKPIYLFRDGFKENVRIYFVNTFKFYATFFIAAITVHYIMELIPLDAATSYREWLIQAVVCALLFGGLYLTLLIKFCPGGRNLVSRLPLNKLKHTLRLCRN